MLRSECSRRIVRPLILTAALFFAATACPAQTPLTALPSTPAPLWSPRVETRVPNPAATLPAGELLVNGIVVLRLRTELGGVLPQGRVDIAADRLRALIAGGLRPGDVAADSTTDKANPRLKAAGQVIATVTPDEAKTVGLSPAELAQNWAEALRRALALPGISVSAERMIVPLGETRVVRVGGAARGPLTVETTGGAKTLSTQADAAGASVLLRGLSPGRETLTLSREGATATVSVAVQMYAGRIETPRPVTVTGALVPADLVTRHALAQALAAARPAPGATARIPGAPPALRALTEGQMRTVAVPLELTGPDMIPVRDTVSVTVTALKLPPVRTTALLYSNNPERVTRFGTLFAGRLAAGAGATRVLYHHQSAMDRAAWFTVELINDTDAPVGVQVVGGGAGPVVDTVWVGYRAASQFFRDYQQDLGAIIEIPRRSRVALKAVRLAPGRTVSGLTQLRQISGAPLLLRVAADIPGDPQSVPGELQPVAVDNVVLPLSGHVYPEPRKEVAATYQAGGRWAFVTIGKVPIKGVDTSQQLEGNYGVFYDIALTLENPTDRDAVAQIAFEPSAGMAGGIFQIDGRTIEIPQAKMPNEVLLARYPLSPGSKQTVQVRTLPLSGSAYPATLIVRPGPVPAAPKPATAEMPPASAAAPIPASVVTPAP